MLLLPARMLQMRGQQDVPPMQEFSPAQAWDMALAEEGPSRISLSRAPLPPASSGQVSFQPSFSALSAEEAPQEEAGREAEEDSSSGEAPSVDPRVEEIDVIYSAVTEPSERAALAAEMAGVDDAEAVRRLLVWIEQEREPGLRRDLLQALATAEARHAAASEVVPVLRQIHESSADLEERGLVLEVMGEVPSEAGVEYLRRQAGLSGADPFEQLTACESLMRVSAVEPDLVGESEIRHLQERLQLEVQATGQEPDYQSQALMALGVRKEENRQFFQQMLASATDPNVRLLLIKLAQ